MNDICYERQCMADREWPSIDPKERVCIQCPRFKGNQPLDKEVTEE